MKFVGGCVWNNLDPNDWIWRVFIHSVMVLLGRTSTLRSHSLKSFFSQPCVRCRFAQRDVQWAARIN